MPATSFSFACWPYKTSKCHHLLSITIATIATNQITQQGCSATALRLIETYSWLFTRGSAAFTTSGCSLDFNSWLDYKVELHRSSACWNSTAILTWHLWQTCCGSCLFFSPSLYCLSVMSRGTATDSLLENSKCRNWPFWRWPRVSIHRIVGRASYLDYHQAISCRQIFDIFLKKLAHKNIYLLESCKIVFFGVVHLLEPPLFLICQLVDEI